MALLADDSVENVVHMSECIRVPWCWLLFMCACLWMCLLDCCYVPHIYLVLQLLPFDGSSAVVVQIWVGSCVLHDSSVCMLSGVALCLSVVQPLYVLARREIFGLPNPPGDEIILRPRAHSTAAAYSYREADPCPSVGHLLWLNVRPNPHLTSQKMADGRAPGGLFTRLAGYCQCVSLKRRLNA